MSSKKSIIEKFKEAEKRYSEIDTLDILDRLRALYVNSVREAQQKRINGLSSLVEFRISFANVFKEPYEYEILENGTILPKGALSVLWDEYCIKSELIDKFEGDKK